MDTSFLGVTLFLLEGFWETAKIFFVTLLLSLPLGLIISFGSMSKIFPLKWLTKTLVWIVRGTPLMLQLIIVYYGPGLIGVQVLPIPIATYITFSINYACDFSEIYRGGIESISTGQHEAYQVLGMTRFQGFFRVILLQVIKRIVPPMSNEIITLVKDTSIARIIGFYEIIFFAQKYIKNAGLIWPLLYTGVFYLIFSGVLSILFSKLEKKLSYFKS
jgi:polar amino acid transport system permease protein